VNTGVKFTVQNLTIANGNSASHKGGGIDNEGSALTVTNSTFSANSAGLGGGGIYNHSGTVMVTNSTFSGNIAASTTGGGGGIGNSGTLTVTNSTFSGNSASHNGGGIASIGTVTVTNSTFSGNSADYDGGGIASGTGTVTNSTVSGNSASHDGGGIASIGKLTVTNTIVANSTTGGNCGGLAVTDGGHNIDDGMTCGFTGTSLSNTNPMLSPAGLANNGGPTQTIALQAGSPAINAGDESVCAALPVSNLDQRGDVRPGTGHANCSIGAYEADATPPEVCVGDCGGTGTVAINNIITMVNIALGNSNVSACSAGDANGDGEITINEIIAGVNNALSGCNG